ncbi:MAG: hypothetical protein GY782_00035, partial [Gammaproteobacteria bacterium]|nr:hypothetical protein [Gammaproteobacteria bacterium]
MPETNFYITTMDVTNENLFLSYNVAARADLGGVAQLVAIVQPTFIFLQEVTLSSDILVTVPGLESYLGVSNVNPQGGNKPGTATLWKKGIEGVVVNNIVPRRIQFITTGNDGTFINVYAPSGTQGERERRVLFSQDLLTLVDAAPTRPTLVGDWNCIIHRKEVEPRGGSNGNAADGEPGRKLQFELKKLTKIGGFVDGFINANPGVQEYTWFRPGRRRSRLDRCYIHRSILDRLVRVFHVPHLTDHAALIFVLKGGSVKVKREGPEGYWKLNSAVVKDKRFRRNFENFYAKVALEKENFDFPSEWFDQAFRPQCRHFLMQFSTMRQQGWRDTVGFLSRCLSNAVSHFDWAEVSRLRESLMRYHREDTMGLVVRSRCQGRLEAEVASIYHLDQGVKRGKQGRLDKLAKEVNKGQKGSPSRILLEDRSQVEDEAITFFSNLLQGFHKTADELGDSLFEPDFSDLDFF